MKFPPQIHLLGEDLAGMTNELCAQQRWNQMHSSCWDFWIRRKSCSEYSSENPRRPVFLSLFSAQQDPDFVLFKHSHCFIELIVRQWIHFDPFCLSSYRR